MTLFWIITAGLITLAMAFIVLPLLRNRFHTGIDADDLNLSVFKQQLAELDNDLEAGILDQERYDAAKVDLEKELLSDVRGDHADTSSGQAKGARWMALSALLVPLIAILFYQLLGSPEIITRLAEQPQTTGGNATAHTQPSDMEGLPPMDELVRRLAAKLEEEPNNPEGWFMLGRSYMVMNQHANALKAFERAVQLDSQNAGILLAYAEAIAATSGNNFTGRAASLIEKAFELDPNNPNALWMAGILAYQKANYQAALERWEALRGMLAPQSNELESVNNAIDDARKQLGLAPVEAQLPNIAQNQPASASSSTETGGERATASGIEVEVSLSPEMAQKASPDDLVFIYAKAMSGPPMPLAAARKQVRDLPLTLRLDDSMAMMPQMKLSGFQQVVVGARVSLSGGPTAQSGDLEGEVKPVSTGQTELVTVVIDRIHP
jgi:cytochrome c-type biogenesis protein CcmH